MHVTLEIHNKNLQWYQAGTKQAYTSSQIGGE